MRKTDLPLLMTMLITRRKSEQHSQQRKNYPHKTLWCAFQPHTYTRTRAFLKDFASALSLADKVILADIYAAREKDPGDISSADLARELEKLGKEVHYLRSFDEIEKNLF